MVPNPSRKQVVSLFVLLAVGSCAGYLGHPFSKKPIFACFHHNAIQRVTLKELYDGTEQAWTFFGVRVASFGWFERFFEHFVLISFRGDTAMLTSLMCRVDEQVVFAGMVPLALAHSLVLLLPNGTPILILLQGLPHLFSRRAALTTRRTACAGYFGYPF